MEHVSAENAPAAGDAQEVVVPVDDYAFPSGWSESADAETRARQCCQQLENGRILYFDRLPYVLFKEDQEFLLAQRQSESRLHKNVSYRPGKDVLRGAAGGPREQARLHEIMRKYSQEVTRFLKQLLLPYAQEMVLDFASFRPEEEEGRDLPLHKRNDLLHCDSFPTRPMNGHRILRCFTNINPTAPRVWHTTDGFSILAEKYADAAGLEAFAAKGSGPNSSLVGSIKKAFGLKAVNPSAYDRFMLRFHDYLKENSDFQQNCPKVRLEFPPGSTWICYTDLVPHGVLSGRFALEQTVIVPLASLVAPDKAPIRVLEGLAGRSLSRAA
jgi:hypothetical protein